MDCVVVLHSLLSLRSLSHVFFNKFTMSKREAVHVVITPIIMKYVTTKNC